MSNVEDAKRVPLPYHGEREVAINVRDLEEFHERHARDTYWARVALITVIFGMLALNLWMTDRSYEAMMVDVDASRLAASQLEEQSTVRLEALGKRLEAIEARLPAPGAPAEMAVVE
jgi:hypothetical protein